jgi:hypothetical protein
MLGQLEEPGRSGLPRSAFAATARLAVEVRLEWLPRWRDDALKVFLGRELEARLGSTGRSKLEVVLEHFVTALVETLM